MTARPGPLHYRSSACAGGFVSGQGQGLTLSAAGASTPPDGVAADGRSPVGGHRARVHQRVRATDLPRLPLAAHGEGSGGVQQPDRSGERPAKPLSYVRLHDLRHIHATHLLLAGVPVHVVADRLGHADA